MALHLLVVDPMPVTRSFLVESLREAEIGAVTYVSEVLEARHLTEKGARFDAAILSLGSAAFDPETLGQMISPLRADLPNCAFLLLTSRSDATSIAAAMQQGVRAYLTTDRSLGATLEAIRFVCAGWAMYPAGGIEQIALLLPGPKGKSVVPLDTYFLTRRQREVLHCLAAGMSNRGIASHLDISQSTVKAHVRGIMARLGAVNRTQAVALLRQVQATRIPAAS